MNKDILKLLLFLLIVCALAMATFSLMSSAGKNEGQQNEGSILQTSRDIVPGSFSIEHKMDYFICFDKKHKRTGYAFMAAPKGYGGEIHMVVGIDLKGRVTGVKIVSMKETPFLGMKASESSFLKQFIGMTSKSPLKAKKDVDAITGATITTQAVADGVKQALQKYNTLP